MSWFRHENDKENDHFQVSHKRFFRDDYKACVESILPVYITVHITPIRIVQNAHYREGNVYPSLFRYCDYRGSVVYDDAIRMGCCRLCESCISDYERFVIYTQEKTKKKKNITFSCYKCYHISRSYFLLHYFHLLKEIVYSILPPEIEHLINMNLFELFKRGERLYSPLAIHDEPFFKNTMIPTLFHFPLLRLPSEKVNKGGIAQYLWKDRWNKLIVTLNILSKDDLYIASFLEEDNVYKIVFDALECVFIVIKYIF
jgi:hypothetical protein